jgi:hypothetical protein
MKLEIPENKAMSRILVSCTRGTEGWIKINSDFLCNADFERKGEGDE